ncbi:MAG: SDR family NAD(P)-dependent oxidoreductase [Desulfobacterales bacterium]|nr:SDR family NAD(P)-dependent oxidoreductase [Desulfobacterales bacterium]
MAKKAIVIGATSGIGKELTKILSQNGYVVGIAGRRIHLLEELQSALSTHILLRQMDVSETSRAIEELKSLIAELGAVDLIVICAGTGFIDPELQWDKEKETIDVNVLGFSAMANVAFHHFVQQNSGHLVGISSVAAIRGGDTPAYNASKAFVSNYLESLRYKASKMRLTIAVSNIQRVLSASLRKRKKSEFSCIFFVRGGCLVCGVYHPRFKIDY